MIIADIKCGMGNQMFQYAYARALQKITNDESIQFNMCTAKRMKDGRTYALGNCVLNEYVSIPNKLTQTFWNVVWKVTLKSNKRKLSDMSAEEQYLKQAKGGLYTTEVIFKYFGIPASKTKVKYTNGWWQSPKYFACVEDEIRRELKIKTAASDKNKKMLQTILQTPNSVCLHVRRGDYLSSSFATELDICNKGYYDRAIQLMRDKVQNPHFFVFTTSHEDVRWIKENWKYEGTDFTYVDLNNPDYEELRLMYSCQHFILANSTFSWWGAFLSDNKQKVVLAPDRWNNRETDYEDIYCEGWIKVATR